MNDVYVLGMTLGHNATAALTKNGVILATASEERFTRKKNVYGYPKQAITYCLQEGGIAANKLDLVVLSSHITPPLTNTEEGIRESSPDDKGTTNWFTALSKFRGKLKKVKQLDTLAYTKAAPLLAKGTHKKRTEVVSHLLGIDKSKIVSSEHHLTHAYTAIYASDLLKEEKGKEILVITVDGEGDMLSSSVGIYDSSKDSYKRIAQSHYSESIGHFYSAITSYLGMKILEHEYKVMGLAPYSSSTIADKLYVKLKKYLWIDDNLRIKTKVHSHTFEEHLEKLCKGVRFDYVAAAAQKLVEHLVVDLVKKAVHKTGIHSVILSGGVFMNVKANYEILKLPEVKKLFIMPSSGDESLPIGSCYFGTLLKSKEAMHHLEPLTDLYYGPAYSNEYIEHTLKQSEFKYKHYGENIEKQVANLLAKGEVVARFSGRMEFGARALGNRSIIADASREGVVEEINQMIKMRDFWMPFAPSILAEHADKYLKHYALLKKVKPHFMTISFESTPLAWEDLKGAMHPADKTLRPQLVTAVMNPGYHRLLKLFHKKTGKYGILNTSFNIHGEPIVCSPEDALHTLKESGLKYLALGEYLVKKQ